MQDKKNNVKFSSPVSCTQLKLGILKKIHSMECDGEIVNFDVSRHFMNSTNTSAGSCLRGQPINNQKGKLNRTKL